MSWHSISLNEIFEKLKTTKDGLSKSEAVKRLETYGKNKIDVKEGSTIWQMIIAQFINPLIIILILACVASFFTGEIIDAIAILVILVLNAVLGVIQEYKAEGALEALREMSAPHAKVIRDGQTSEIPSQDLVPGDVVVIASGDLVPTDLRLTEAIGLACNEAILTGESKPAKKDVKAEVEENATYGDRYNTAFSGTTVTTGRGIGIVVSTGMNTAMGSIASSLAKVKKEKTPLDKQISQLGLILGIVFLVVCGLVFGIKVYISGDWTSQLLFAVSLAVASIPEGLPAVVTIVLSIGTSRMSKKGAIIRRLSSVETLGATTVICTDKTGTLTENKMKAEKAVVNMNMVDLFRERPDSLGPMAKISAGCNDATYNSDGEFTGDPTEIALLQFAMSLGVEQKSIPQRVDELSFDSKRKAMTTVHLEKDKLYAYTKGAFEVVLDMSSQMLLNDKVIEIDDKMRDELKKLGSEITNEGYRTMGFAYKYAPSTNPDDRVEEKNMVLVGFIGLNDPIRADVPEAVERCKKAGIKTVMVTGDHPETAMIYARKLGIADENDRVVTGKDFVEMGDKVDEIIPKTKVFARVAPEHKLRIVDVLQSQNNIVAMTGDGVNDAPALKKADIGVSMGITGCEVAKDSASLILTDDSFSTIVSAVYEGRVIYDNIKKFIWYMLGANIGEVFVIVLALILKLSEVPLEPIQLLWINLLTDSLPALAIGVEPAESGIMNRPPRDPKKKLISGSFLVDTVIRGFIMGLSVFIAFLIGRNAGGHILGVTYAFTTIVIAELVLAYACRSFTKSMFEMKPFANPQMLGAIAISFLLFLPTFFFPEIFKTTTLSIKDIGIIIGLGLIPAVVVDIWKFIKRALHKNTAL